MGRVRIASSSDHEGRCASEWARRPDGQRTVTTGAPVAPDCSRQCPVCARHNGCGVAQDGASTQCWCFSASVCQELVDWLRPQGLDARCLCADCAAGNVPSPCVSTCRLDDARTHCVGCGRTVAEITDWRSRSPVEKAVVLRRLRTAPSSPTSD
ncbi:MAG: cysteine-rich CWC family protein [Pseudomonadota bacterium]